MVAAMAMMPASAQISCLLANAYGEPKRSLAITADALKTITRPVKTSSMVTAKSHRSTLTRLAMTLHFTTELRRDGEDCSGKDALGMTGLVPRPTTRPWLVVDGRGRPSAPRTRGEPKFDEKFPDALVPQLGQGSFDCVRRAPHFAQDDRVCGV